MKNLARLREHLDDAPLSSSPPTTSRVEVHSLRGYRSTKPNLAIVSAVSHPTSVAQGFTTYLPPFLIGSTPTLKLYPYETRSIISTHCISPFATYLFLSDKRHKIQHYGLLEGLAHRSPLNSIDLAPAFILYYLIRPPGRYPYRISPHRLPFCMPHSIYPTLTPPPSATVDLLGVVNRVQVVDVLFLGGLPWYTFFGRFLQKDNVLPTSFSTIRGFSVELGFPFCLVFHDL